MNAAGHYLLALAVMALLAGVMIGLRRFAGPDRPADEQGLGGCCGGCNCHRGAPTDSNRDA